MAQFSSRAFLEVVLAVFAFHQLVLAEDCDKSVQAPVSIPVRNVTLEDDHIRRGLEFRIGTPPQSLAIGVSSSRNSTYIYDQSPQCGTLDTDACIAVRGGAFDESSSSTWSSYSAFSQLGNLDPHEPVLEDDWLAGTDTLSVTSSISIADFPVGIPRNENMPFSTIGMGPDSSLLTALRNRGSIASRSYSLFWGETGVDPENQSDGALILGGYDKAKTSGENYTSTLKLGSACSNGLMVAVTNIELMFPNGTSASITAAGATGQSTNYCVEPNYPIITMFKSAWDSWMKLDPLPGINRASENPNLWGLLYPKDQVFQGDLKITIEDSFAVTIPNHQLVQRYYFFDSNGDAFVNDTVREMMINPLFDVNKDDIPIFGLTFLQAAYLHVNYDEDTFTLWQANSTSEKSLVGVGASTKGCAPPANSTTSTTNTTSTTSTTSTTISTSTNQSLPSSLSAGVIGGIVGGVVIALTIAAAAVWVFWFRKRRQSARRSLPETTPTQLYHDGPDGYATQDAQRSSIYLKPELDASTTVAASNNPNWVDDSASPGISSNSSRHRSTLMPSAPSLQELPAERYR